MKAAILILGILLCSAATAGPQPWMIKEDPETLRSVVIVGPDCPVRAAEFREIVNGVLIRSRLRTGEFIFGTDEFGFVVYLQCIKPKDGIYTYMLQTDFIRWIFGRLLVEAYPYGSFGRGDQTDLRESIRKSVEKLVTDYLQANFDLAPK